MLLRRPGSESMDREGEGHGPSPWGKPPVEDPALDLELLLVDSIRESWVVGRSCEDSSDGWREER
jgi:hypothetical protein